MMCMCCFFVLYVMMTVCAISQRNNRNSIVEYEIESTSVKRRKRSKHLHQEPIDSPSPMASDNSVTETSRRRKRKALARDPTMETIYKTFRQFTEMVGPVFKMMSETAARKQATAARKEAARKEIEEKKKLLSQVIFEIDGLSNDEAIFILQVLVEDEDQLKTLFYVPDDKRLCFCRVLLTRMSYCPPSK
ncbi:Pseudouridine synthase protein [Dioscorea alata]|uniref:Pseudouridine synthase protein n=2 Tax=Dioscorea alata TaxID=55571 RepID=A0ACB7WPV5_DIOAL|nr:Pseudouridine synthase protein [Dioscorea alata]KAH7690511.1 Pseudouridine synthase protein [Dioscorea alata]